MTEPHWYVLGAGAIGCLFASALHRGGSDTTLVLRESIGKNTTPVVIQDQGSRSELHLPVTSAAAGGTISHLLVTTKAYDVRNAVETVRHRLTNDSTVLLLVNGMGLADELQNDFPQLDIFCGTTTEGAYRIGPQHIQHAGSGLTRIGQPGRKAPAPWFAQWSRSVESCVWDENIEQALWLKLAINCAINPLTALHNCHNGDLARRPELAHKVARICDEIAQISSAAGYQEIAATVHQTASRVIAETADNRSSMLQDVGDGRRTEIDYITGYLLKVARRHGIDTPYNSALMKDIHNIGQ